MNIITTLLIIVMGIIGFLFILAFLGVPPLAGPHGLLRVCTETQLSEALGMFRKCYWIWDSHLAQPSYY